MTRIVSWVSLLVIIVALMTISVGTASPEPGPVCHLCNDSFERAAASSTVQLTVVRTVATVELNRNGSATWTVRNTVRDQSTIERLRSDQQRLRVIAKAAINTAHEFINTSINETGVVTRRYRTPHFATHSYGVLLLEYFREDPANEYFTRLGSDRLTVIGPEGTVITEAPRNGAVDGREITFTSFDSDDSGVVVFASDDGTLKHVRTELAIFIRNTPRWIWVSLIPIGVVVGTFIVLRLTNRIE